MQFFKNKILFFLLNLPLKCTPEGQIDKSEFL